MASERQLFKGGENTHAIVGTRVCRLEQKRGLTQVGPAGKGGHLLVTQPVSAQHRRQRIAEQRLISEDIQLLEIERAHRGVLSGIKNQSATSTAG